MSRYKETAMNEIVAKFDYPEIKMHVFSTGPKPVYGVDYLTDAEKQNIYNDLKQDVYQYFQDTYVEILTEEDVDRLFW